MEIFGNIGLNALLILTPPFSSCAFECGFFGNLINLVQYFRLVLSARQSAEAEQ